MTTVRKDKLEQVAEVFKTAGFQQQHPRIYHHTAEVGNYFYHISAGLEDYDEQNYEVNISVLQRPLPKNRAGFPGGGTANMAKAVPLETAPVVVQDKVRELNRQLGEI